GRPEGLHARSARGAGRAAHGLPPAPGGRRAGWGGPPGRAAAVRPRTGTAPLGPLLAAVVAVAAGTCLDQPAPAARRTRRRGGHRSLADPVPARGSRRPAAGELSARSEEHTSELQSRAHLVCR